MSLSLYYKTLSNNFQNYNNHKLSDIVGNKYKYIFWQSSATAEQRLELDTLFTDKELEHLSNKVEEATAIKLNLNYLKNNNIIYKGKGNYTKIGIPILSKNKIFLIRTRTLSPSTLFWPLEQHLYPHLHLKVFVKVIWDDEYDEIIVEEYSKKEITWRSTVLI